MTDKIILTDADGVLLDWEAAFHDWMKAKGYTKVVDAVYDLSTAYAMPKAEAKAYVREFNESAWVAFLPAFRDARSGVAKIAEAGYKFVCITSLSLDPKAAKLRMQNLEDVFGKDVFIELICLDTGADKDEVLERYAGSNLIWIEDKPENAECGAKFGLKSLLISHAHNADYVNEDVVRVADWAEITKVVLG
jgi:FMN phosphatase YigB (HAD superfamily)